MLKYEPVQQEIDTSMENRDDSSKGRAYYLLNYILDDKMILIDT